MIEKLTTRTVALALATASLAVSAGQLSDKTDRFQGSRQVAWESHTDPGADYSYNVYAFYAKAADKQPLGYYSLLVPARGTQSFSSCSQNFWLIDGKPAPSLRATYDASSGVQMFKANLTRADLERIAAAQAVEFKICNSEAAISASDIAGVKKLLEATK